MTLPELLSMMRLLSAVESAMLMSGQAMPSHLYDDLTRNIEILEREILAGAQAPAPGVWHPESKAPRDDSILVYLQRIGRVTTGHKDEDGQWWSACGSELPTSEISHWMLLPTPPKV